MNAPHGPRAALEPVLVAAAIAAAYLITAPASADLAAQEYRVALARDQGPFTFWDGGWYGGHHTLGYSVLYPPLGALMGARVVGALAAVAAAGLFALLVERRWGYRARIGALWLAAGAGAWLFTGRLTFLLGVAVGLGALLAAQRGQRAVALLLAVLTALASPVAGLFLGLAGVAWAIGGARSREPARRTGDAGEEAPPPAGAAGAASGALPRRASGRRGEGIAIAVAALAPILLLAIAFPEGGTQPFPARYLIPVLLLAAGGLTLLPRDERVLRAGLVLYALGAIAAAIVDTPVGGNVTRLGALFGGPVLLCALAGRRPAWLLAVLSLPLAYWQLHPPVRDTAQAAGDASTGAAYHRPLIAALRRAGGPPGRVEIPPLRVHGEARFVAPAFPLARGWERQLDTKYAPLFYESGLTAARYRAWLDDNAVRWVAVADAPLDGAAKREAALVRRGLPYLKEVWHDRHWRLYAVSRPRPLAAPPLTVVGMDRESVTLRATAPGSATVRVRPSPYWAVVQGAGCVAREGDWTRVTARRPGLLRLALRFAPRRVVERGSRCK